MKRTILAYLLIGVCCGVLTTGWWLADFTGRFPQTHTTRESCREEAGRGAAAAVLTVLAWPILVPTSYLLHGFAQHGWMAPWSCDERYPALTGAGAVGEITSRITIATDEPRVYETGICPAGSLCTVVDGEIQIISEAVPWVGIEPSYLTFADRETLLKLLASLSPDTVLLVGYKGDDGEAHPLTERDLAACRVP